jgi:GH24 family phage-related lysozyme (muramidase)
MSEPEYGGIFDNPKSSQEPEEYGGIFKTPPPTSAPSVKQVSIIGKYEDYNNKVEEGIDVSDYKIIEDDDNFKGLVEWKQPENIPYTVSDFENDPRVIKNYEVFTDWFSQNETLMRSLLDPASISEDGVAERMRDFSYRISSKVNLATLIKDAPDEVKEAFSFLQDRFENAEVTGLKEHLIAAKDIGTDVLANYETMPLLISGLFSKGTVPLAVQGGARLLLHNALKRGSAAVAKNPIKAMAAYSGAFSGADDLAAQKLNIAIDKQDEYDLAQTGVATGVGALFGAGLGWGAGKVAGKFGRGKIEDLDVVPPYSESQALQVVDEAIEGEYIPASVNDIIEEARRLAGTPGKEPIDITPKVDEAVVNKFADDVGGGAATKEEVTEIIMDAVKSGATGEEIKNKVAFKMMQLATGLTAKVFFGKAAGLLTPLTKYSNTADSLQKRLAHEFSKGWGNQKEKVGLDFSEVARRLTGDFNEKYLKAIEPLAIDKTKGELTDATLAALNRAIRGEVSGNKNIDLAAAKINQLFNDIGTQLVETKTIDKKVENYIPRMWNRKAIEEDEDLFKSLLVESGQAKNTLEAERIVKDMLNIENQLSGGTGGSFFAAQRKLIDIEDDSKFAEFFEKDLSKVISTYNFQAGKSLAKVKVFGVRNQAEFEKKWIVPIEKEMLKAGKQLTKKEKTDILKLYQLTTSEGLERFGDRVQAGVDGYSLLNRLAYLPAATLSSLTEAFINISKAGVIDSVKGFGTALNLAFRTISKDMHSEIVSKHGLTSSEAWREMKKFGLALEQGADQIGNRLAGDDLVHEGMQKVSNKFFRVNLLDQWTHFVESTSFATGKNMIEGHLKYLASRGSQARTHKVDVYEGRMNELGIDIEKGKQWAQNGAKKEDPFYEEMLSGAARYAGEVILQPTAMSNLKPMLHSHPQTSMIFQLLGYPAAFTNTVLKGAAKELVKSPVRNGPKIALAALLMTETSRWLNYVRSHGENEEFKSLAEIYGEAVARWGGNGAFLDSVQRAQKASMYADSLLPFFATGTGPITGDLISLAQQGFFPTVGKKIPGYGAIKPILGPEAQKEYNKKLRELEKTAKDKLIPDFEYEAPRFNSGGKVERSGYALGTLVSKTSKAASGRLSKILDDYTDNIFNSKEIEKIGDDIEYEVEMPLMSNTLDSFDIDTADVPSAGMFMDEAEEADLGEYFEVRLQATLKEKNEDLARLQELETDVDPMGEIDLEISPYIEPLKEKYDKITRKGYEDVPEKMDKYDSLAEFVANDLLENRSRAVEGATINGLFKGARQHLYKIFSEGGKKAEEVFEMLSEAMPSVREKEIPEILTERTESLEKFLEDSEIKIPVYRGVSSYVDLDRNISFALPREIGTHVGTEGQANAILARQVLGDRYLDEIIGREDLTRGFFEDLFQEEYDFKMLQRQEAFDVSDLKDIQDPLSMQKGYISVKNPLVIEEDSATWSASYLFSAAASDLVDALESNLGRKLTKKENNTFFDLAMEARELEEYPLVDGVLSLDPKDSLEAYIKSTLFTAALNRKAAKFFKELGFDSIKYKNEAEPSLVGEEEYSYILFDSEQFKQVNSIAFDPTDPRDMYNSGGLLNNPATSLNAPAASKPHVNPHGDFFTNIGKKAETDHGDVPKPTKDAKEKNVPVNQKTKDVGYGHKVKDSETASRTIHGIEFIDDQGNYIPLTEKNKKHILMEDMKAEANLARKISWDTKLTKKGSSWDKLDEKYRNVLTSLAYNTGGTTAGAEFDKVLDAAINKDVKAFAKELRRNEAGKKTAGMDNRVLKELYYADLIKDASEVSSELPLANATQAGVPAGKGGKAVKALKNLQTPRIPPQYIDRVNNPQSYPVLNNPDGSVSTHEMAAEIDDETGRWLTFPMIQLMPDGSLRRFEDTREAMSNAKKQGNFLQWQDGEKAKAYAKGGYKKGTPLAGKGGKAVKALKNLQTP